MSFNTGFFIQQDTPISQYSMLFDGVNESINCYNNAAYNFTGATSFTISAWVKAVDYSLLNTTICGKRSGAVGYLFQFSSSNLQVILTASALLRIVIHSSGVVFTNNTWNHVAFSYNGSTLASGVKLYVNGQPSLVTIITDTLVGTIANTGVLSIGQVVGGFWNGNIGHVNIWNIELTAQNILNDYNGGKMRNTNLIEPANLVLSWKSGQSAGYSGVNWYYQDDSGSNVNPSVISVNMEHTDRVADVP